LVIIWFLVSVSLCFYNIFKNLQTPSSLTAGFVGYGKPLSPELISNMLGFSVDFVKTTLNYLEKRMTFLYRNRDGDVVWAYPVTVDKTPHKITFNTGENLYAA